MQTPYSNRKKLNETKMWKNKEQNSAMDLRDEVDCLTKESELNLGMIN